MMFGMRSPFPVRYLESLIAQGKVKQAENVFGNWPSSISGRRETGGLDQRRTTSSIALSAAP